MNAESAITLYRLLDDHGVRLWLDGGWGIDALIGQQTRPHKDLDALVIFDDLAALVHTLAADGFQQKLIWEENRWVAHPTLLPLIGRGNAGRIEMATAFVFGAADGRELDFHVLRLDNGLAHPAWNFNQPFDGDALHGLGTILGQPVRCLSPARQMWNHTGYALQPKDLHDLRLLHERFGTPYLAEQLQALEQAEA